MTKCVYYLMGIGGRVETGLGQALFSYRIDESKKNSDSIHSSTINNNDWSIYGTNNSGRTAYKDTQTS